MKYAIHKIHDLNDLENLVSDMARAQMRNVHVEGMSKINYSPMLLAQEDMPEGFWDKNNQAVVNTKSNCVAQMVSPNYRILQHSNYFAMVADLLRSNGFKGIDGYAIEGNGGNHWNVRLIFDGVEIEEPGMGKNIKVGAEFSNSYDSIYAARGRAYYMRFSCENQMILGNVIPEAIFSKSHLAPSEQDLLELVTIKSEVFFKNLLDSGIQFKEVMETAIDDEIVFKTPDQLETAVKDIFKVQTHTKAISEIAERMAQRSGDKYSLSRWDLYNAATDYASHSPISPNVMDNILHRAETKILGKPVEIEPVPIRVVA